jgi:hypothetical protein
MKTTATPRENSDRLSTIITRIITRAREEKIKTEEEDEIAEKKKMKAEKEESQASTELYKEFIHELEKISANECNITCSTSPTFDRAQQLTASEMVMGGGFNNKIMRKLKVIKSTTRKRQYKSKKQKNRRKSTLKHKNLKKYKSRKHKK